MLWSLKRVSATLSGLSSEKKEAKEKGSSVGSTAIGV